jgi:hypothetical protein
MGGVEVVGEVGVVLVCHLVTLLNTVPGRPSTGVS